MCTWMCVWLLAWGLFWMTGGDWRCWSLTLLDLKLNGQINRCCRLLLWNHLLTSTPIRQQQLYFFFLVWSTLPSAQCRGAHPSACVKCITKQKQISENDKQQDGGEKKKSFDKSYFAHSAVLWCVYINCGILWQSDMKRGKWSPNPIWNGQDKVPGKFRGTELAGRRAEGEK